MRANDLLNFYRADRRVQLLLAAWNGEASKTELKGIVGSASALVAASILHPEEAQERTAEQRAASHLFILDDKESAAYFLNDL